MTYLVLVHGVATRRGGEYDKAVAYRTKLIEKAIFDGRTVTVSSPAWGDLVPVINADVYKTDADGVGVLRIGSDDLDDDDVEGDGGPSIAVVGKQSPVAALDAVFAQLVEDAANNAEDLDAGDIEAFVKAVDEIASNSAGAIFDNIDGDDVLAQKVAANGASYGIESPIRKAIGAVSDRIKHRVSTVGFGAVRGRLTPTVGIFFGDVFAYLNEGETRDKIRAEVREDLTAAHAAAKKEGRALVLMGHSLGGVILTDMLMDPKNAGIPEDITVASLITIGSQPGFFGTLNLLANKSKAGSRIPRPACVKDWMNIFDPIDPFAFRADMIFEGVKDYKFETVAGLFETHSAYFSRPQFYARARSRLKELGII